MFRNPIPRRPTISGSGSSSILSEHGGQPLFAEPFNPFPMTLDELIEETLLEAARLKNRARKVPEFAEHIRRLQDVYKNQIAPAAQSSLEEIPEAEWEWLEDDEGRHPKAKFRRVPPKASADELYKMIKDAWQEAVGNGLSQEEFDKFVSVLDQIRQEWRDNPEGPHRLGPHEYSTEQEHLAAYPAQWLTAGLVGSARAAERPAAYGSYNWIWNSPDTGATATGGPGGTGKNKEGKSRKSGDAGRSETPTAHVSSQTVHTAIGPITPEHFRRKPQGRGTFHTGQIGRANEDILRLANVIPEDVNSTWDGDRLAVTGYGPDAGDCLLTEGDDDAAAAAAATGTAPQGGVGGAGAGGAAQAAFQEADKAAALVKQKLAEIQKAGGLTPDQAKKFAEFGQYLIKAAQSDGNAI